MNVICSYESPSEASVKLFLCKANHSFRRFNAISEDNLFDREQKNVKYKPVAFHMQHALPTSLFYTVIASNFDANESIGGTLTIESSQPLVIREIPSEGAGLQVTEIGGEWTFANSGGCQNFGMYRKNPCFAINVPVDTECLIRMKVLSEVS